MKTLASYFTIVLILLHAGCGPSAPAPKPKPRKSTALNLDFHNAIRTADRIVVTIMGCCDDYRCRHYLFDKKTAAEINQVHNGIEFDEKKSLFHCTCHGQIDITWYAKEERIAIAGIQHGVALRWTGFGDMPYTDAQLTEGSKVWLEKWLNDNGVRTRYPGLSPYLIKDEEIGKLKFKED